jgi:tetratricopeptide (TPR) repeat protein
MFESTLIMTSSSCTTPLTAEELSTIRDLGVSTISKIEEARSVIEKESRFITFLFCGDTLTPDVDKYLRYCSERLCTLNELQFIVCNDPDIKLQCLAHELGFQNFWPRPDFIPRLKSWASEQVDCLNSPNHPNALSLRLAISIAQRKFKNVTDIFDTVVEESKWDYRVANVLGHYHAARKEHEKAELAFASAHEQNPAFLPTLTSLGTSLLKSGKSDQALQIFKKLELVNDSNPDRKTQIAQACADLGLWDEAQKYAAEADKLEPGNSKSKEVQARILFHTGKPDEAIALIDSCETTNEYFIGKLNDEGIRLSRANLVDKAILLYRSAHKIAPSYLKYKLSFNIALAFRRNGEPRKALAFAERAQQECKVPNFDKINILIDTLQKEAEGK